MNSLPPKEYASLPKLDAPAGYICVLRDIDRDVYRIDSTDHPTTYMDALLVELTGSYGIELLSILVTDDIAASENHLFERHHAALSDKWLELDAYQMRALRQSELRILDYGSYYISQPQTSPSSPALEYYRYGKRRHRRQELHESHSPRLSLSDRFVDFWHNHPGLVIAIMLILLLLSLIHLWRHPSAF